jgi:hypothetical protein
VITYYKSRYLLNRVVYVQEDDRWKSYAAGGVIRESPGEIPEFIRNNIEEVPAEEVQHLIRQYLGEEQRLEAGRQMAARPGESAGLGGWLVLPIIGLFIACIGSIASIFLEVLPYWANWTALTSVGSGGYHPLMGPYIGFRTFVVAAMIVGPLFLLILIFMKKRILPQVIIYFYVFALFATLIDFVALVAFLQDVLIRRGFAVEAAAWVQQGMVTAIVQGVVICGIWIPYFLYSKRVRNTFVRPWSLKRQIWATGALAAQAAVVGAESGVADGMEGQLAGPAASSSTSTGRTRPPRILLVPVLAVLVIVVGVVIGLGVSNSGSPGRANRVTVRDDASGDTVKHYANSTEGFSFDYPGDWVLNELGGASTDQSGFALVVVDPAGAFLENQYVDGVTVNVYRLPIVADASTIADARSSAQARVEALAEQDWKTLTPFSDVTINGMPGFTVTCSIPITSGQRLVSPIYFLFSGDRTFDVILQSAGQPSDELDQELDSVLYSFKPST